MFLLLLLLGTCNAFTTTWNSCNSVGNNITCLKNNVPSTYCRVPDSLCLHKQREALKLSIHKVDNCFIYTWNWTCTADFRIGCGIYWCDPVSICVDDMRCVCPNGSYGDAALKVCNCNRGTHYHDGITCQPLNTCKSKSLTPVWILISCGVFITFLILFIKKKSTAIVPNFSEPEPQPQPQAEPQIRVFENPNYEYPDHFSTDL